LLALRRRALKAAQRLDIANAGCAGEKEFGVRRPESRRRHECCPFTPGGDLGMSRLKDSFSQLTRRTCLRRVGGTGLPPGCELLEIAAPTGGPHLRLYEPVSVTYQAGPRQSNGTSHRASHIAETDNARATVGRACSVVEGNYEPALETPPLFLDQNAVHDGDLGGGTAEAQHCDAQPDIECRAQRDAMSRLGSAIESSATARLLARRRPVVRFRVKYVCGFLCPAGQTCSGESSLLKNPSLTISKNNLLRSCAVGYIPRKVIFGLAIHSVISRL
jgi:hypothetical protein